MAMYMPVLEYCEHILRTVIPVPKGVDDTVPKCPAKSSETIVRQKLVKHREPSSILHWSHFVESGALVQCMLQQER